MSDFEDAKLILTPNAYKAGKAYCIKPFDGSGDLTVVRNTTATRVNENGLIEVVAVNVPRVNYPIGGGCPSWLIEPQATNRYLNSEPTANESSAGNITYEVFVWGQTIFTNCVRFLNNPAGVFRYGGTTIASTQYTISAFVIMDDLSAPVVSTSTSGGDFTLVLSGLIVSNPAIVENYGNNIYRVSGTGTTGAINLINNGIVKYAGHSSKGFRVVGWQLEQGSYATSYIPTNGTAVTRNADVFSKANVANLIGQTEGSIFIDFNYKKTDPTDNFICVLSDNSGSNGIWIDVNTSGAFLIIVRVGGASLITYTILGASFLFGRKKIMLNYKSGNTSLFINGAQIGATSTTSFTFPVTIDKINVGSYYNGAGVLNNEINDFYLTTTRLTDAEAVKKTTL